MTVPRLKVLALLENAGDRHMSAEDIYKELLEVGEDIGLATVYRVLSQFESAGLVIRHHFEEGRSVFELDDGQHHDHLVCLKCENVIEFVDPLIEKQQLKVAKANNFQMTDHALYIYGICKDCQ